MKSISFLQGGRRALRLVPLLLLCVLSAFATGANAQVLTSGGPIVRQIDVQYAGQPTISRERILSNMRTTVGQPFVQANAEEDIRSLYGTGDITNVRIFSEPANDGVKVIVIVATRATIKAIVFRGNKQISARKLKGKLTIKEGRVLNEETVESDRQKLLDYYGDKGFEETDIKSDVALDDATNTSTVTFTVTEGPKGTVQSVNFEGNQHVSTRSLRFAMKNTRGKTIISFIDKSGRLDTNKLHEDLDSLRELYQNKGYIDVDIQEPVISRNAKGNITLLIRLREGGQYRVSTLNFEGTQVFTDAEIRRFLKMKEGAIYSPKGLKDDKKTIEDYYGSRGYVDARVVPEGAPSGPNTVALRYKIEEGGQSYVERVNIEGNTQTKDKVIRREIPVAPGDVFNTVLVEAGKKRLENLGYFEKVDTNPVDTTIPGRKDLDVLVQEKRTGSLSFGAGFSSIDSLVGQVELTQGNFDITNIHGFTGGGQKFRATAQYGLTRKDFTVSLTEPYFLDTHTSLGGEAFYHDSNYVSNDYNQQNLGFAINARRGLTRYTSIGAEYRFEDVNISGVTTDSQILQQEVGSRTRSAIRLNYSFDTRDSVFLTRRGTRIDVSPYVAGGPLGGSTDIFGFDVTASQYVPFRPIDGILLINGEIGSVDTWNGGDRVPVYDRLYLGGANNLRGFGFRKVGPKDFKGTPVGGRTLVRGTAEFTVPVITRVRAAAFADAGFLNQDSFDFSPQSYFMKGDFTQNPNRIRNDPKLPPANPSGNDVNNIVFGGGFNADIGIGLRLDLPIGPIRLDYALPVLSDDYNDRKNGRFTFNVGYQF